MDKLPAYEPPSPAWLMSCICHVGAHYLFRDLTTGEHYVIKRSRRGVRDNFGNILYYGLEESRFSLNDAPDHIKAHFTSAIASMSALSL